MKPRFVLLSESKEWESIIKIHRYPVNEFKIDPRLAFNTARQIERCGYDYSYISYVDACMPLICCPLVRCDTNGALVAGNCVTLVSLVLASSVTTPPVWIISDSDISAQLGIEKSPSQYTPGEFINTLVNRHLLLEQYCVYDNVDVNGSKPTTNLKKPLLRRSINNVNFTGHTLQSQQIHER